MSTLIKIIVSTILSFMLLSCNLAINSGIEGNGHVTTENRPINAPFSTIKASQGLDVYLTQSEDEGITVETDENLQPIILTEITDGVLKIHLKENIGRCSSKKVTVRFKTISEVISSSGSDIYSTNTISVETLHLKSSSGSDIELDVNIKQLSCKASSGSDLKLSGKTINLIAEASSGGAIKAADLFAEATEAKASSGSDITVNTSKSLIAKASSGGDVKYYGNPEKVEKSNNPSGSIKQK
ncbi:head GIN domain-containing protein [Tamlana sp. 2_MG-2023]|uniref:head GIN domain-containing protein n=1 Tax=unclassified Tamlana TaxID=2614803 RepID=UPI0026E4399F|nr:MULTISPECIES: head GIN domain-containing protein [unclassified Tamlana]MDO6760354.1 head GIN domain-containing protein [Tamlana sp. 2_MG-2023]MDO6789948.1 head GIN domain-containing protein [Tamlana sp. 1_MG-2023]